MPDLVRIAQHGDVAVLDIDNPPVNALGPGVPDALAAAVEAAALDPGVSSIVIRGAGRTFVAGADITQLEAFAWGDDAAAPDFHGLFKQIEDCAKPVVMAIHGSALGGGLELAMAGHYRVALASAQLGQPEVNLGIIPGGEGSQRLPRLVGIETALALCVTGAPIGAADAVACGLVDELVAGDLTASAVAFARRLAPGSVRRTRERANRLGSADINAPLFAAAHQLANRARPHQTAPHRVIEAIAAAAELPFDEGCRREREIFLECLRSDQARALIHVFFAERAFRRGPAAAARDELADRLTRRFHEAVEALVREGVPADRVAAALSSFGMTGPLLSRTPASGAPGTVERGPGTPPDDDLVDRCVAALVNEGAWLLESGSAALASEIDAIAVARCGFPAWRGGPMFYADQVGLVRILRMVPGSAPGDERRGPAPRLIELAQSGSTFRAHDRARRPRSAPAV